MHPEDVYLKVKEFVLDRIENQYEWDEALCNISIFYLQNNIEKLT